MDSTQDWRQQKAYLVAYGTLTALFFLSVTVQAYLPHNIMGIPSHLLIGLTAASIWLWVAKTMMPRCPKCNLGLMSVVEISGIPIVMKGFVGKRCSGCGLRLQ